jgi:hypothetical protein
MSEDGSVAPRRLSLGRLVAGFLGQGAAHAVGWLLVGAYGVLGHLGGDAGLVWFAAAVYLLVFPLVQAVYGVAIAIVAAFAGQGAFALGVLGNAGLTFGVSAPLALWLSTQVATFP